jgi:Icc protein
MYQVLAGHFDKLGIPTYGLPGNHDENDAMAAGFRSDFCSTPKFFDLPHWRLVLIDSTIPRQSGGHISDDQFHLIHTAIEATEKHVLIALHHNPISTKSAWLDRMTIDNGEHLMELARQSDKVKAVVWGHVHQEFDASYEGVRLLATPSTCMQFTPKATRFDVDELPPGFRLLALLPNGEIETQVVRATFENPYAIAELFENQ